MSRTMDDTEPSRSNVQMLATAMPLAQLRKASSSTLAASHARAASMHMPCAFCTVDSQFLTKRPAKRKSLTCDPVSGMPMVLSAKFKSFRT